MPTVRVHDAEIFYEVTGDGDPVLMIMGLGTDSRGWVLQLPAFSAAHRVIVFDNRGAGRSSPLHGPYTTADMARDSLAVLDAAGVERAHVLGVSMGGAIAQHLALEAPDRVRSLVLASTWAGPTEWRSRLRAVQVEVARRLGREALIRMRMLFAFSPRLFADAPGLARAIERAMNADQAPLDDYLLQMDACEAHDLRTRLPEITAPALLIAGARDILVPPEITAEVAGLIPGAAMITLESGHAVQFEAAEAFNRAVLEFFARHAAGRVA